MSGVKGCCFPKSVKKWPAETSVSQAIVIKYQGEVGGEWATILSDSWQVDFSSDHHSNHTSNLANLCPQRCRRERAV